jgi:hypothetical protein
MFVKKLKEKDTRLKYYDKVEEMYLRFDLRDTNFMDCR